MCFARFKVSAAAVFFAFICALASVLAYRYFGFMHALDVSPAERNAVVSCLLRYFDSCVAAEEIRGKLNYKFISVDKLFLLVLSLLCSWGVCSAASYKASSLVARKRFFLIAITLLLYSFLAQYFALSASIYTWDYLLDSWVVNGVSALKESCFSMGAREDCAAVRQWLNKANFNVQLLSWAFIAIFSFCTFVLGVALGRYAVSK